MESQKAEDLRTCRKTITSMVLMNSVGAEGLKINGVDILPLCNNDHLYSSQFTQSGVHLENNS